MDSPTFPQNVEKTVEAVTKLGTGDKARISIGLGIVVNIALIVWLSPIMTSVGIPVWLYIIIQVSVFTILIIYIIRIVVLKEPERIKEVNDGTTDSFSRMYYLRNLDSGEVLKIGSSYIPMYEMDNGQTVLYIKCLFGEKTDEGSIGTREIYHGLAHLVGEAKMELTCTVSDEVFEDSPEYADMLEYMSNIDDPLLSRAIREVFREVTEITAELSSVDCVVFRIKTRSVNQKYIIEDLMRKIYGLLEDNLHNFRRVQVIYKKEILDYFKDFYGLEAIDLSRMKLMESKISSSATKGMVEILSFVDMNGTVYSHVQEDQELSTVRKLNI